MILFTHGSVSQRWGVALRLLLKSDILGLLKIGLNLATWKAVRCWGTWVKPSPWYGNSGSTKNNTKFLSICYEYVYSTWIVEFLCCTSSGYRIPWSEKTKTSSSPPKLGPLTPQILEAFVGYQPQSSASHRSAGTACLRKKKSCLTRARLALPVNETWW